MAHARLPSSNTKQWSTCAGSAAWTEAYPEPDKGSNYFADMGTAAHHLVELCLRKGSEPVSYLGRGIKVFPDGGTSMLVVKASEKSKEAEDVFVVDVDMHEAVAHMTRYVRMRCFELGLLDKTLANMIDADGVAGHKISQGVAELVKRGTVRLEVQVTPLPNRDDTGGTSDVVIDAWPVVIEVVDYKNGSGVFVPVTKNHQLRSYGLGTLNEFGFDDYERVVYTICQPRHTESPANGIMSEEMTTKDLKAWGNWLYSRAEEVDIARAMVASGATMQELYDAGLLSVGEDGSACTWCHLKGKCPAQRAKAEELLELDFADKPFEVEPVKSNNHLSVLVPWVPFLRNWLDSVLSNAETAMLAGDNIAGQKLIQGQSNRVRKPDAEDKEILKALAFHGVKDKDKMYNKPKPAALRTIPQLEKLLPVDKRVTFSNAFTDKPPGKITMVPEDHPSPAVSVVEAKDDFDDEPEVPS